MSDKINVMIVEDQAMPRQLFEAIVKSEPRLNLAVSIDNAEIADICCARHDVDLVLMDVVTKKRRKRTCGGGEDKKDERQDEDNHCHEHARVLVRRACKEHRRGRLLV